LATPSQSRRTSSRPAATAASHVSRATALLAVLALASSVFVLLRLTERWHVAPVGTSHRITLLGQSVSYPAANFAAIVVLVLGVIGLAVVALALTCATRELAASVRFGRRIARLQFGRVAGAFVFADERPLAFCAGLLHPKVYISNGALAALNQSSVQMVLLHEQYHARRFDPLRLAMGRVVSRSLFFVPGIDALVRHQEALTELGADEWAIGQAPEKRSALARAMLTFSDPSATGTSVGIDPARVDHLLGEAPQFRFPALVCLSAVASLALVVAVGFLVSQVASGSATLAPPFLSDRPCVITLALIPTLLGLSGYWLAARGTLKRSD
jgi:hypothetical protein